MLYMKSALIKILGGRNGRFKWRIVLNHSAWWVILVLYEQCSMYASIGKFSPLAPFLLYYALNIGVFYCQVCLLKYTLNGRKKIYAKLAGLFVLETVFFLGLKIIADLLLSDFTHLVAPKFVVVKSMAILDLLRNLYFAAFGTLYWTITNISDYRKRADLAEISELKAAKANADLEIRLARSQNAYLQQQINPHFLFNSLNFIHSSVYKLSRNAAENIILLSDIMRFSFEATDADGKITLAREAEQIENLIKLNRSRFDYPLDISYSTEGNLDSHKIIPLVIMTLAENLFKHGDLSSKPAVIRLSVSEGGELKFYTSNHKRPAPPVKRLRSIGLENIRTRLSYTYGDNFRLAVNETDEIYVSELTLNL